MGSCAAEGVGKRKSMHPTPNEQRPFVYLMKCTERRSFLRVSSVVVPSYAPGGVLSPFSAVERESSSSEALQISLALFGYFSPSDSVSWELIFANHRMVDSFYFPCRDERAKCRD